MTSMDRIINSFVLNREYWPRMMSRTINGITCLVGYGRAVYAINASYQIIAYPQWATCSLGTRKHVDYILRDAPIHILNFAETPETYQVKPEMCYLVDKTDDELLRSYSARVDSTFYIDEIDATVEFFATNVEIRRGNDWITLPPYGKEIIRLLDIINKNDKAGMYILSKMIEYDLPHKYLRYKDVKKFDSALKRRMKILEIHRRVREAFDERPIKILPTLRDTIIIVRRWKNYLMFKVTGDGRYYIYSANVARVYNILKGKPVGRINWEETNVNFVTWIISSAMREHPECYKLLPKLPKEISAKIVAKTLQGGKTWQ